MRLLSAHLHKKAAPLLLRYGLSARYAIGRGIIQDNPYLDGFLLIPTAQSIISILAHDDAARALEKEGLLKKEPSALDKMADKLFDRIFGAGPNEKEIKEPMRIRDAEQQPSNLQSTGLSKSAPNLMLQALEKYLRPALVPSEQWSDISRWKFNIRFLKWVRAEFLIAKHGLALRETLIKYPQLNVMGTGKGRFPGLTALVGGTKSSDVNHFGQRLPLPSSELLVKALGMQDWNRTKDVEAGWKLTAKISERLGGTLVQIPGLPIRIPDIPADVELSELTLEELLEVIGGHVASCGPFNALCEERGIYEFWTRDYVTALASYLLDRANNYGGETIVLDIGAGDGALTFFLREFMENEMRRRALHSDGIDSRTRRRRKKHRKVSRSAVESLNVPRVVATDDGSWTINHKADVEVLDVKAAMKKYSPIAGQSEHSLIVICSWMPMGEDWTAEIRSGGADEYILIGECDDGNCGDNWLTWGNADFRDVEAQDLVDSDQGPTDHKLGKGTFSEPPYSLDGFVRTDLNDISRLQFSRFDSSASSTGKTVSFRRMK